MEDRRIFALPPSSVLIALFLFLPAFLHAEDAGEYSLVLLPDGTPRFTQILRWDADPNVLFYEITLQTGAGEAISVSKVTEPVLELNLSPGEYRYRIVLYNLLRKPEIALPWQGLTVLRAEIPRIANLAPKVWYLEDLKPSLTIRGENLIPGATVVLKREEPTIEPASGIELGRDGTSAVSFAFPAPSLTAGEYAIELTNPGGLSVTVRRAVLVRHMLAEPSGLEPVSGSAFGPKELRGMRSIRFSWNSVPEAAKYVFRLYARDDPDRLLREEPLTDGTYLLDDLTVLERGEFRWSVEAQGIDEAGELIPAVRAAEARFVIDLPRIVAPVVKKGDVFYGR
jgi:hypothetical protein